MSITRTLTRALNFSPSQSATLDGERSRNWTEVSGRVARLAGALQGLGIGRGERVAILALNSDLYLEWLYAVPWMGAVLMPLNTRLAVPEILANLADAEATVLVVDSNFLPMVPALRAGTPLRLVLYAGVDPAPEGTLGQEALISNHAPIADLEVDDAELAGLFYTGGTTGRAKGVMLSHANLIANCLHGLAVAVLDERTRYLHLAPMFHLADLSNTLALTMVGGSHVFLDRFEPRRVLETLQQSRINTTMMVPSMLAALLAVPGRENYDLSCLSLLAYGASPMPESVLREAMRWLPHTGFQQGYGMTELAPLATALAPRHHQLEGPHARRLRSCGRAVPGVELRIVDSHDVEVPRGQPGEVVVRGANVMLGYWRQPQATAAALRGGWMHTGDVAVMDDEAFVYIVDRAKDMIISGGENIYSIEVENALHAHPEVLMCAVFGIPSEQWGEQVHAVVQVRVGSTVTATALIEHCRALIAAYKCPRTIELRAEMLPLSGAGKILKHQLRAPYWEGKARNVG